MTRGLIFWVLMLIWLVLGLVIVSGYAAGTGAVYMRNAGGLLEFLLFLLLGWQVYGPPVQGG